MRRWPLAALCASLLSTSLAAAQEPASNVASAAEFTPASSASPPAAAQPSDHRWLAWTAVSVGGGLLAVSAWQWIVFANKNSEGDDICPGRSSGLAQCVDAHARARYINARDDAKQARTLGAILGGLGAAAVVTGILLWPDAGSAAAQPTLAFSADPLSGDARASVSWRW